MRKYNDAEIARLEFLLQQATARITFIREYHPIFIELREQAAGPIRSKNLTSSDSEREELEWFYGQYYEE